MLDLFMKILWPSEPFSSDAGKISWLFYLIIGFIFWFSLIITLVQYRKRSIELRKLQQKLEGFRQVRSEAEIFGLEEAIRSIALIEVPWWEFKATLVRRGDTFFSRAPFHDFFHLDSLEPHRILTPRVAASIPSTLTVLGILGTFVSLVIGLTGLNLGDQAQLQQGVGQLISSVNTAYLKSIWGVSGSVIFLFVDRWASDQLRYQIEKIATLFDRLFTAESSESWLSQVLTQQEQQTAALKAFNTDLSDLIRQANTQVVEALGGVGNQVTSVARENAKGQEEVIREVLEEVVRVFRDQMIDAVKNGMSELTNSLESVAGRMDALGKYAAEITASMQKVAGDLTEAQKDLVIAVSLIEKTLLTLNQTVEGAQKAAEDSRKTIEQLVREQKSTSDILGQFDSITTRIAEVVAALERCQKDNGKIASAIAGSVAALDESLMTFTGRFETVNKTLSQTATDFAESVRLEVEKYCVALDGSLANASASLRTAVKDIEDVLPNASTSLGAGVKSMEEALKRLETAMARLKPEQGALQEMTTLLGALKAWEAAQSQEKPSA